MTVSARRKILASVLAVAVTGCAAPGVRQQAAVKYDAIREKWTRKDKLLKRFDLQLSICATYLSAEFRQARRNYISVLYALSREEAGQLEKKDLAEMSAGEEFLVGVFVPDHKHDKLDRKRSPWHLRMLVDDLDPLVPVKVERFKISEPDRHALYPHLEIWDRVYKLVFPKKRKDGSPAVPSGAKVVKLALDGPLGVVRLVWHLDEL